MISSAEIRGVDLAVEPLVRHDRSNIRRRTKPEYSCASLKAKVDPESLRLDRISATHS